MQHHAKPLVGSSTASTPQPALPPLVGPTRKLFTPPIVVPAKQNANAPPPAVKVESGGASSSAAAPAEEISTQTLLKGLPAQKLIAEREAEIKAAIEEARGLTQEKTLSAISGRFGVAANALKAWFGSASFNKK